VIRPAGPTDLPELLRLIRALADYEREPDAVETTQADLRDALFPEAPAVAKVRALVAEVDGRVVGMAVYFVSFSTWTGRHGIYLEDLFVAHEQRGRGIGRDLLAALAREAVDNGFRRLEWAVLDWNESAISFYKSLGAHPMDEWTTFRLTGEALTQLSRSAPSPDQ
jgi:GNAT superfamily N-acetyltransferase